MIHMIHIFLIFCLLFTKLLIIASYSFLALWYFLSMNLNLTINGMNLTLYLCELFLIRFKLIKTLLFQFFELSLTRFSVLFNIAKDRLELIFKITLQLNTPISITSFIGQFLLKFTGYWSEIIILLQYIMIQFIYLCCMYRYIRWWLIDGRNIFQN